jgi:hypothetical protein
MEEKWSLKALIRFSQEDGKIGQGLQELPWEREQYIQRLVEYVH